MSSPNRRTLIQGAALTASLAAWGVADAASAGKKGELYVIAEIVSKPDTADQLRTLLVPFAAKARKEPGCHEYKLMEDEKQPGRFLTFERWSGHPALEKHMKTPHIEALVPKLEPVLAKPFTQIFLRAPRKA